MISSFAALAVGGVFLAPMRAYAAEQGVEELTRGPVHEAFATTISFDPEPGMIVRMVPPAMIEEIPPEQRLEGDNVAWIPGYWGWDEDQNDFIWISGVWRNLPPGRQWVPGYWGEVDQQWQWTSGYWEDEAAEEVAYLPEPPKSIESGPSTEAPSRNHIWISGTWVDNDDRYAWRPGYWEPGQENWTWIPAHYLWTRRGYIFVDGYWDHDVIHRGVVFAPVRFQGGYHVRPDFCYTPLTVINLNVFSNHLFVRPRYGHYYFGDYYSPRYRDEGYHASFAYRAGRSGYDPIYAHCRWQHRDNHDWEKSRHENFNYYRDNQPARPPHTWAAMQSRPVETRRGQRDNYQLAAPLNQYVSNPTSGQRFAAVTPENRTKIVEQRQQVREFSKERQQLETRTNVQAAQGADKGLRSNREKLVKSPVVAKRTDQFSGRDAPPRRLEPKASEVRGGKVATGKSPGSANPNARAPENHGKKPDPAIKPNVTSVGRPAQGSDSNSKRMAGPDPKTVVQPQSRSAPKQEVKQVPKPATDPRGRNNEPEQPKKQVVPPERKSQPAHQAKSELPPDQRRGVVPQPNRALQPQTTRQPQPNQQRHVVPQPQRAPQPQTTRQTQPDQRHKVVPQPNRQQQPQTTRQPQPQPRQQAVPQPAHRTAEPQRQQVVRPQQSRQTQSGQVAPGGKKNAVEEELESRKGR